MGSKSEPMFAALDIGTNSFHLVVAKPVETGFEIITSEKEVIRLGHGAGGIAGRGDVVAPDGRMFELWRHRVCERLTRFKFGDDAIGVPFVVTGLVVATKRYADGDRGRPVKKLAADILRAEAGKAVEIGQVGEDVKS